MRSHWGLGFNIGILGDTAQSITKGNVGVFAKRSREFLFIIFFFLSFFVLQLKYVMYNHIYWHGKMFTTYCWMTKKQVYLFFLSFCNPVNFLLFDNGYYFKIDIWIFWNVFIMIFICCIFTFFWVHVFLPAICFSCYFPLFPLFFFQCLYMVFGCFLCVLSSSLNEGNSSWTGCVCELRPGGGQCLGEAASAQLFLPRSWWQRCFV